VATRKARPPALMTEDRPPLSLDEVDWRRLAEPQHDQYDSQIILRLASETTSHGRPVRYARAPAGSSPTIFDGSVAVRHVYAGAPEIAARREDYIDGPVDHQNLQIAAAYVGRWPAAFVQCQTLLDAIHPAIDTALPFRSCEIYRGSSSHSLERFFGTLWVTIHCPIGTALSIVHELSHQKLRALGVSIGRATTVVGNRPDALYASPIIKDRLRPMTAVLHAQYAFVHVAELLTRILDAEPSPDGQRALSCVLRRDLGRICAGYDVLRRNFQPGPHGAPFMDGFLGWMSRVVAAGQERLARHP
jgi:hypothetical protein